ncbi:MAG: hypothetical protein R3B09_25725 [Nannocystaceae bacterium]
MTSSRSSSDGRFPRERGLFSRLVDDPAPIAPDRALVGVVRLALATRVGESLASPHLGTPDFADLVHGGGAAARTLQTDLRAALLRSEPTLQSVQVRVAAGAEGPTLRLDVAAQPRARRGRPLVVRGEVSPEGAVLLAAPDTTR